MTTNPMQQIRELLSVYSRKSCSIQGTGEFEAVQTLNGIAEILDNPDWVCVPRDTERDAVRYRFLCDDCTSHYGDGYTEPCEAHVSLEWGQGAWIRDGSNGGRGRADVFPGWSAIIDKMMEESRRELERLDDPSDKPPTPAAGEKA